MREQTPSMLQPVSEEDIAKKIHQYAEGLEKNTPTTQEDYQEVMENLHKDISLCSIFPVYLAYKQEGIPTLRQLEDTVKSITKAIDEYIVKELNQASNADKESIDELNKTKKILTGRPQEVRHWVRAYVDTVITFHNLKKLSLNGTRDLRKQFESADHKRRRTHNSLIEALRVFKKAIDEVSDIISDSNTSIVMFNEKMLEDRNFIRDWALAADFTTHLRQIREQFSNKENN